MCSCGGQRLGVVDRHEAVAPTVVGRPDIGGLHSRAGGGGRFQQAERKLDGGVLHLSVIGLAYWIPQWKVGEDESGDATFFDDVARRADNNGWDPFGFKVASDQTDRLVTDGSKWHEQRHIDVVIDHPPGDVDGVMVGAALAVVSGNAIEAR